VVVCPLSKCKNGVCRPACEAKSASNRRLAMESPFIALDLDHLGLPKFSR
jgi:hypothetical protein